MTRPRLLVGVLMLAVIAVAVPVGPRVLEWVTVRKLKLSREDLRERSDEPWRKEAMILARCIEGGDMRGERFEEMRCEVWRFGAKAGKPCGTWTVHRKSGALWLKVTCRYCN